MTRRERTLGSHQRPSESMADLTYCSLPSGKDPGFGPDRLLQVCDILLHLFECYVVINKMETNNSILESLKD